MAQMNDEFREKVVGKTILDIVSNTPEEYDDEGKSYVQLLFSDGSMVTIASSISVTSMTYTPPGEDLRWKDDGDTEDV